MIEWKDGRAFTRGDAEEWFTLLRQAMEQHSAALREDLGTDGNGREICIKALSALREYMLAIKGFKGTLKPLDYILTAMSDLDRKIVPPLFQPRRDAAGGAPKKSFGGEVVMVAAVASVELAMRAGYLESGARDLVAREFAKVTGMVGPSGLAKWREWTTPPHTLRPDIRGRIDAVLDKILQQLANDLTQERAAGTIRDWAKALADNPFL